MSTEAFVEFRNRIEDLLRATARLSEIASDSQAMEPLLARFKSFEQQTLTVLTEIVRPRVEILAGYFPHAAPERRMSPQHCTWQFGFCEQFPAYVKLDFSCGHDEQIQQFYVHQELSVIPSFIHYEHGDRLIQPLASIDHSAIGAWVETRLLSFLQVYLQLETTDRDQSNAFATDPVCHMRIVQEQAAGWAEYKGHRYFFCSTPCQEEFLGNPEHFVEIRLGLS